MAAGWEFAEPQRTETNALQRKDRVSDVVAHPLDLAFAALVNRELERVGRNPNDPRRRRPPVIELDARSQRAERRLSHRGVADDGAVGLVDFEARVHETVGQRAVVGQKDQTGAVGVQPPDRIEPQPRRDERDDRPSPLWISGGRDDARRLVDGVHDDLVLGFDGPAVEGDIVPANDVAGGIGHGDAADRHPPGSDDVLGAAARGDSGHGQELAESHSVTTTIGAATIEDEMDLDLVTQTLTELAEPPYRLGQIWKWTAQGASSYESMTDLPQRLRGALGDAVPFSTLTVEREAQARDGTVKALFRTVDGRPVEAVLMRYRDGRHSLCLSSQSGCPLTCTFCATGSMRFGRNLTASEILDQALHFRRLGGVDHAVFMGMGEPMMNLDNVLGACERLPDLGITHRRTAISTVGWIPGIERMTADPKPVRLALSLHAADEALRSELMPVNDRYPLAGVLAACRAHYERKRRKVFVEYVMLAGINDSHVQARALGELLEPWIFKVNLIPYNPTDSPYQGSSAKAIEAFRGELERQGIDATVRLTRGRDIDAACGQLAVRSSPTAAGSTRT